MRVHSQDDENISVYKLLLFFFFISDGDADTRGETKLDETSMEMSRSGQFSQESLLFQFLIDRGALVLSALRSF